MTTLNRRDFIKLAGAGAAALALPQLTRATAAPGGKRPNILLIMSDEHNASVLGCYGNQIARTPNLDALAARGVVFERNYCNSPLCVPSRLSFTAGKFASRVSAWNNSTRLPSDDYPALPRLLRDAGYDSVLCGKMHYDATHRYGFREIGGNMNNSHMNGRGNRRPADDIPMHTPLSARYQDFHPGDESRNLTHDERVVKGAQEFFHSRKPGDKPFFLLCGFITPHFPLIVPEKYWKNFEGKVPPPNIPQGYLDSLPLNYKALRAGFQETDVPADVVKKGRELYYGLTQWMDERAGEIIKALAASGEADNTIVIYTADHGENMGEHGLWWKNSSYDSAARVPLIISYPARWQGGQRRALATSGVDVAATIADLGGAKVPADWNGTPLTGLLNNAQAPWKDVAVTEYYAHNIVSGFASLRTGDWKYVYHNAADAKHPAQRELYNLKEDPAELHNLAVLPEHQSRLAELHARLVREIGEEPEKTEQRCRAEFARGYEIAEAGDTLAPAGKKRGRRKRARQEDAEE